MELAKELFYQSLGYLSGRYFPSAEDERQGALVTASGMFAVRLTSQMSQYFNQSEIDRSAPRIYCIWLRSLKQEPWHVLKLVKTVKEIPEWLSGVDKLLVRGKLQAIEGDDLIFKLKRNRHQPKQKNKSFYVRIKGKPSEINQGEFWQIEARLEQGLFVYCTGTLLADKQTLKAFRQQQYRSPAKKPVAEKIAENTEEKGGVAALANA